MVFKCTMGICQGQGHVEEGGVGCHTPMLQKLSGALWLGIIHLERAHQNC